MKIAKKSDQNHFPTCNRLVTAGRRCKAAVVTDIKLFRPRKQGNGKSAKIFKPAEISARGKSATAKSPREVHENDFELDINF